MVFPAAPWMCLGDVLEMACPPQTVFFDAGEVGNLCGLGL